MIQNEIEEAITNLEGVYKSGEVWCGNYDRAFKSAIAALKTMKWVEKHMGYAPPMTLEDASIKFQEFREG